MVSRKSIEKVFLKIAQGRETALKNGNQFLKLVLQKSVRGRIVDYKNTPVCCRESGNVYNYKANWRVAGEPAVLESAIRPGTDFINSGFSKIDFLENVYIIDE